MNSIVVRRSLATAAVTALTLTGLSACGSKDGSQTEQPPSSQTPTSSGSSTESATDSATAATTPSPTAASATPTAAPASETGTPLTADAFAAIYKKALDQATTANLTLQTGGAAALSGTGQIDFTKTPPEVAALLTSPAIGGKADVRLVGGAFYLKLPTGGAKFLKYDLDDPSNPIAALITSSLDPSALVDVLRKGIKTAVLVGTEGDLKHYALTVDSKAILAQYPPAVRSTAAAQLPATVNYDLYFDDKGFLRRTRFDLGAAGTTTQSYDDWGTKVNIVAPPASQVTEVPTS